MKMKYASVIVTFNRKLKLEKAIQSILIQSNPVSRIIIIDNASTDGTQEMMRKYNDNSLIDYRRLDSNMGGAMGFFEGIRAALKMNVDWISLSDDDAIYKSDFFENIARASEADVNIKCFTGTVMSKDGSIQLSHRRLMKHRASLQEIEAPVSMYSDDFYVDGFTFVGVVLKKTLISKIGLPEKDFFIWRDDDEYSLRVRKYTKIKNISNAQIVHLNNSNKGKFSPDWKEYYGIRNRLIIERKYSKHSVQLFVKNIIFIFKRVLAIFVKPSHFKYARYLLRQLIDGYVDGMHNVHGINKRYLP